MECINPAQIESIIVDLELRKTDFVQYKPKKWYRTKPYYQVGAFLGEYDTKEELMRDFPEYTIDENNICFEMPCLIIKMCSKRTYTFYYKSADECKEALQILLNDMAKYNIHVINVNELK